MDKAQLIKNVPPPKEELPEPSLIGCPACGNMVSPLTESCPKCGRPIAGKGIPDIQPKWNPGIAALLSVVIPGLGQIYKNQILNGVVWFVFVVMGYIFFFCPGVFLHICCIAGAMMGDPYRQRSRPQKRVILPKIGSILGPPRQ